MAAMPRGLGARRGTTRGETKGRVMVYEAVIEPAVGLFRGPNRVWSGRDGAKVPVAACTGRDGVFLAS
jgi:hypothetical protein